MRHAGSGNNISTPSSNNEQHRLAENAQGSSRLRTAESHMEAVAGNVASEGSGIHSTDATHFFLMRPEVLMRRSLNRRRSYRSVSVLGMSISLALSGCAVVGLGTPNPFAAQADVVESENRGRNQIVPSEIRDGDIRYPTAYQMIQQLRPRWLQPRGQVSMMDPGAGYPTVYIDEIRHGNMYTLREIPSHHIRLMEFINAADATTRWGTGHRAGVINVVTGR